MRATGSAALLQSSDLSLLVNAMRVGPVGASGLPLSRSPHFHARSAHISCEVPGSTPTLTVRPPVCRFPCWSPPTRIFSGARPNKCAAACARMHSQDVWTRSAGAFPNPRLRLEVKSAPVHGAADPHAPEPMLLAARAPMMVAHVSRAATGFFRRSIARNEPAAHRHRPLPRSSGVLP
jgi:hypothetical protein